MSDRPEVDPDLLDCLRTICLELPEAVEEVAWVGVRWRVRGRTFAHVLEVDVGWPPAYARLLDTQIDGKIDDVVARDGPVLVLMFRSSDPELTVLRQSGAPFLAPPWRADEVGIVLDDDTDWTEISELLTESFVAQAPASLAAAVRTRASADRPDDVPVDP